MPRDLLVVVWHEDLTTLGHDLSSIEEKGSKISISKEPHMDAKACKIMPRHARASMPEGSAPSFPLIMTSFKVDRPRFMSTANA